MQGPTASRRLAASAALALVVVVAALVVAGVVAQPLRLVAVLGLLAVAVLGLWYAASREGMTRRVWAAAVVAALAGAAAIFVFASESRILVRVALLAVAFLLGRYALGRDERTLRERATPGVPVPAAAHGVLIINLKSGGGKAERFHLEDECRRRGIEPVVLERGDDLLQLARDAIARGADVVGMAGGDGSQALVASVAAERDMPMVVVPAGTRNHLALDLGLDRDDVVGALDAFGEAVEQRMDLAQVNGRVFVNNVSLGAYARIVASPEYRDAKRETTLAALPQILGPDAEPFDLRFDGPRGEHHSHAQVVQVSNDPYGSSIGGLGTRPRLDTGRLGIVALDIPDDRAARTFFRDVAVGRPERYEGLSVWETPSFELASGSPVPVGLDGETLELEPPLVFESRPRVLRVRLPKGAIGYSPAARAIGWRRALPQLWRTIRGKAAEPLGPEC